MISEKKKKEYLTDIVENYLKTSKSLLEYYKAVATTRKGKYTCNKSIKTIDQALVHLRQIKHVEILDYIYSTFFGNNVIAYTIAGSVVLNKKLNEYDLEENIGEFRTYLQELKDKSIADDKERKEKLAIVKKAQEEGKKVEMVWDKDTKTAKPMIIEDGETN